MFESRAGLEHHSGDASPAEQNPFLAHWVIPPVAAALILFVIGILGIAAHDAWLVPSLGSAVFVQVMTPGQPSGRLWNTAVGQLVAVAAGFAAVYAVGASTAPAFMTGHPLVMARLLAAALGIILTVLLQRGLQATCPAGGAVVLLIAVGTIPATAFGAVSLIAGIALVTVLGEVGRLAVLRAA